MSFTVIVTMDYRTGEIQEFEALIPTVFVDRGGEEAMQAACGRIRSELSAHEVDR